MTVVRRPLFRIGRPIGGQPDVSVGVGEGNAEERYRLADHGAIPGHVCLNYLLEPGFGHSVHHLAQHSVIGFAVLQEFLGQQVGPGPPAHDLLHRAVPADAR